MPQAGTVGSERTARRIQHAREPLMRVLLRCHRLIPAKQSEHLRILLQRTSSPQIHMSGVLQQIFSRRQPLFEIRQTVDGVAVQIKISQSIHLKCIGNMPNAARAALLIDQYFYDIKPRLFRCRILEQPALRGLNQSFALARCHRFARRAPLLSGAGFDFRKNQIARIRTDNIYLTVLPAIIPRQNHISMPLQKFSRTLLSALSCCHLLRIFFKNVLRCSGQMPYCSMAA